MNEVKPVVGQTVKVALAGHGYDIRIGSGLLARIGEELAPHIPSGRAVLITDTTVAKHWLSTALEGLGGAGVTVDHIILPPGEATKSFSQFESLLEQLIALKVERRDCLIALGGGVIGDLVGFAASVLRRGVPFIQIPTSLLAQVDSSVGGKTAINSPQGKNLIGTFYQPQHVLIDVDTLDTLDPRELRAGYAEVVKYGAIGDRAFFDQLISGQGARVLERDKAALIDAITYCCRAKARVVAADEREAGERALLNLGHTFGHGLEALMGFDGRLLHGEAVAVGMVLAAQTSALAGLADLSEAALLADHFRAMGMKASIDDVSPGITTDALIDAMAQDKKSERGKLVFILGRLGAAEIKRDIPLDLVVEALNMNRDLG